MTSRPPARPEWQFDWSELAFGSKKPLRQLRATFIMSPRELSARRFGQLLKQYLPQGDVVLGIAKEPFVDGFGGQPQFRTLEVETVAAMIAKTNASSSRAKVYTLRYFQREADFLVDKLDFQRVVLVNGSWQYAFHNRSTYYLLANGGTPYDMVSPFAEEAEAQAYEQRLWPEMVAAAGLPVLNGRQARAGGQGARRYEAHDMLAIAGRAARLSYDYSFQTGAALGKPARDGRYELLAYSFNKVVPYQTYALHHGAARERHFSPPHDLNHYDAVHAEVELLVEAQRQALDMRATHLFINLLPCPACARMLSQTGIEKVVYHADHSNGYAVAMLEAAGKRVERLVADGLV